MNLLLQRRFGPLFFTQFCGAYNDNLYKNALIILIAFEGQSFFGMPPALLINLVAALFILPFLLFSVTAGECADKWDKARLMRLIKLLEIILMAVGALSLITHQLILVLLVIFLLGCHSAFFGPLKFAILPQHVPVDQLLLANGWVEMGTFVAILLGTNVGGLLMGAGEAGRMAVAVLVLLVAITGYGFSRAIPPAPSAMPDLRLSVNPLGEAWRNLRRAGADRVVLVALLGNSWFWFYGATFLTQFPSYTRDTLGATEAVVTLLWTVLTLAVGTGSLMGARLARGKLGYALVPLGGLGMTFFAMDLASAHGVVMSVGSFTVMAFISSLRGVHVVVDTALIGFSAGAYIVPLYVLIQSRTAETHRARMMGTTNLLNALFMVVASLLAVWLLGKGFTIPNLFLMVGVINAVALAALVLACPMLLSGMSALWRRS